MRHRFLGFVFALAALVACGCSHCTTTFRLIDRQIKVTGAINLESNQLEIVREYDEQNCYHVLAKVTKVEIRVSSHPSMNGTSRYEVRVLNSPTNCPFQPNARICFLGSDRGDLPGVTNGCLVDIVFEKQSNKFLDIKQHQDD